MSFDKIRFKVSLLAISLVLTSAGAVSMLIPSLLSAYPHEKASIVESIITLSTLSTFIFVVLNDRIVHKIGYRTTVLLGLIFAFIGGITPCIIKNFKIILLMRVLLGIGLGLCNPLAVSLINIFFSEEKERASMLGLQNAISGFGLTLMTFIAGILSVYNWQFSFLIYLVLIPVFILFYFFVPEPEKKTASIQKKASEKSYSKPKISPIIFLFAFIIFSFFIFYFTMVLKGASLIVNKKLGTTMDAGNILSLRSLATMFAAAFFGQIYKITKKFTLIISYVLIGSACLLLYMSSSLFQVALGMILGGFSSAIIIPYIYILVGKYARKGTENKSVSAIIVGSNSGIFLSPYIINIIPKILHHSDIIIFPFLIASFVFLFLGFCALIVLFVNILKNKKTNKILKGNHMKEKK